MFNGFILLPENVPPPPEVRYPSSPPVRDGTKPTVTTLRFASAEEMAREAGFPIYAVSKVPLGVRPGSVALSRFQSGEPYSAGVSFMSYNPRHARWENTISVVARPHSPSPFPMWATRLKPNGAVVWPEKVPFLPRPGLLTKTARGYVFHWVENGIYYYLRVENNPSYREAETLAASLKRL